jgi:hypothetical protein
MVFMSPSLAALLGSMLEAIVAQQAPGPVHSVTVTYRVSLIGILAIVVYVIMRSKKRKQDRQTAKARRRNKSS